MVNDQDTTPHYNIQIVNADAPHGLGLILGNALSGLQGIAQGLNAIAKSISTLTRVYAKAHNVDIDGP